ncbi:hypothetical protein AAHA92_18665 [Salvia divinorum]|uniref:Uncharacterized protein n=1 Tax=Salvia divinorum TaxID=28513 RepID=A0ABD1H2V7_SALDI
MTGHSFPSPSIFLSLSTLQLATSPSIPHLVWHESVNTARQPTLLRFSVVDLQPSKSSRASLFGCRLSSPPTSRFTAVDLSRAVTVQRLAPEQPCSAVPPASKSPRQFSASAVAVVSVKAFWNLRLSYQTSSFVVQLLKSGH